VKCAGVDCVLSVEQVATGRNTLLYRSRLWRNSWILHHDSAPLQCSSCWWGTKFRILPRYPLL
jgi:hypothetical protein